MSWYLNYSFSGPGKYISVSIPASTSDSGRPLQIEWEIEFEARKNGTEFIVACGPAFNTATTLLFIRSGTDFEFRSLSNANWIVTTGVTLTNFNIFKIRSTFDGTTRLQTLSVNGAVVATRNPSTAATDSIGAFFGLNSSSTRHGDFKYLKFTDFVTPANNRLYDANASGGTGTILPETINGFNGTQVGTWPSDDSEWVFYSSGAIDAAIAFTMPQMAVSASGSVSTPSIAATIAVTMPQMTVAAVAGNVAPGIAASISFTMPQMQVAAVGSVSAPVVAAVVNFTMPQMVVASIAESIPPAINAVVNFSMPQMTVLVRARSGDDPIPIAGDAGLSVSFSIAGENAYSGSIGDLSRFGCIITTTASNYSGVIQ
jgi:hypothetical protein